MQKKERQKFIMEEVRTCNRVRSMYLGGKLNVSMDTIRRDLKELADKGRLKKVHGGAIASTFSSFHDLPDDMDVHGSNTRIVRKALPLIGDNMVIIIDGGTMNLELAKALPLELKATVCTNALKVALVLCDHPGIEVCFLGGRLHKGSVSAIGLDVIDYLSEVHADICFMGTSGVHATIGITENDRERAMTKKAMMTRSSKVVFLSISGELGKVRPFKVSSLDKVHVLVTELDSSHDVLAPFRNTGIMIM